MLDYEIYLLRLIIYELFIKNLKIFEFCYNITKYDFQFWDLKKLKNIKLIIRKLG